MVGSLSHLMNAKASGYQELPDFPEDPPDPSVRNVEVCDVDARLHGHIVFLKEIKVYPRWKRNTQSFQSVLVFPKYFSHRWINVLLCPATQAMYLSNSFIRLNQCGRKKRKFDQRKRRHFIPASPTQVGEPK